MVDTLYKLTQNFSCRKTVLTEYLSTCKNRYTTEISPHYTKHSLHCDGIPYTLLYSVVWDPDGRTLTGLKQFPTATGLENFCDPMFFTLLGVLHTICQIWSANRKCCDRFWRITCEQHSRVNRMNIVSQNQSCGIQPQRLRPLIDPCV